MARVPLKTLTQRERQLLTPFLSRQQTLQTELNELSQDIVRILELLDPGFQEPGHGFDPATWTFYVETPGQQSVDLAALPGTTEDGK